MNAKLGEMELIRQVSVNISYGKVKLGGYTKLHVLKNKNTKKVTHAYTHTDIIYKFKTVRQINDREAGQDEYDSKYATHTN